MCKFGMPTDLVLIGVATGFFFTDVEAQPLSCNPLSRSYL